MSGFVYEAPPPKDKKEKPEETINITISVFFDGTQNNLYNTEARKLSQLQDKGVKLKPEDEDKVDAYQQNSFVNKRIQHFAYGDDSYQNDYSNVARLFQYYESELKDSKDKHDCVYVEGIGTDKLKSDGIWEGVTDGKGSLGVREKVKNGCKYTADKIEALNKSGKIINTLTIDVFGFSRGAAAARNFVWEITKEKRGPIKEIISSTSVGLSTYVAKTPVIHPAVPANGHLGKLLEEKGIEFEELKVRFAGIYDTVASFGSNLQTNIEDLFLHAVNRARHVLHLTAEDEHRKLFPLNKIITGERHIEKSLPGVHSDIGGSYEDNMTEKRDQLLNSYSMDRLEEEKKSLIREGWYIDEELTISSFSWKTTGKLTGIRKNLTNKYSFIALHIMCDFAMKIPNKVRFQKPKLNRKFAFSEDKLLVEIDAKLRDFVEGSGPPVKFYPQHHLKYEIQRAKPDYLHKHLYESSTNIVSSSTYVAKSPFTVTEEKKLFPDPEDFNDFPELKRKIEDHYLLLKVRNKYLHWSSDSEWFGMDPNRDEATKNRKRVLYE